MDFSKNKVRLIGINVTLFAFLYLTITFNKEYIRPLYGKMPTIGNFDF